MPDKIGLDTIVYLLNDFQNWSPEDGARSNKDWIRNQFDHRSERPVENGLYNFNTIDQSTLKWKSWKTQGQGRGQFSSIIPSEGNTEFDQSLNKLTATEFRKLHDQVKEAGAASTCRYKSSAYKKYYQPKNGDTISRVYRTQLAASLKTFKDRRWTPYEGDNPGPDPIMPQRSRPSSSVSDTRLIRSTSRPGSSRFRTPTPNQRPRSSPLVYVKEHETQTVEVNAPDDLRRDSLYDTLTPNVIFELSDGLQPESVYGDRPESVLSRLEEVEQPKDSVSLSSRPSTATFGISRGETPQLDVDDHLFRKTRDHSLDRNSSIDAGPSDKETDIESDEEDYPEPQVRKMSLGDLPNLALRPEKVDALDVPIYARGDRRKYEFDATSNEGPSYEFANPLSENFQSLNLLELSMKEKNWRDLTTVRSEDPTEEFIIDRLIEFEKLQKQTIEMETARQERLRAVRARHSKSKVYPLSRVQSAKTWREKKCCVDCVQSACVGDCPTKSTFSSTNCLVCSEKECNGNCSMSVYESRTRGEHVEEKPQSKLPPRPLSCNSCQSRHTAKLINANNLILGRPKSGHATFARGQNSLKPKDIRSKLPEGVVSDEMQKQLEDLSLEMSTEGDKPESVSRPGTAGSIRRRHVGRAGVLPGKSYFSQRRVSLTDKDIQYEKAKIAGNKNIRSGRRRRPKTAT